MFDICWDKIIDFFCVKKCDDIHFNLDYRAMHKIQTYYINVVVLSVSLLIDGFFEGKQMTCFEGDVAVVWGTM